MTEERGGGRREERNQETRRSILVAATAMFSAVGWKETKMQDIARDAGVSIATLYNHFPSKHSLIAHSFREPIEDALAWIAERIETGDPPPQVLVDSVRWVVQMLKVDRNLTFALFGAIQEETQRYEGPPISEGDARAIAPFPKVLALALEYFIKDAVPNSKYGWPPVKIASYHMNGIMLRILMEPDLDETELVGFAMMQIATPIMSQRIVEDIETVDLELVFGRKSPGEAG